MAEKRLEDEDVKFYTSAELAKMMGVLRETVEYWCRKGKIKAVVTPGGHYRIPEQEVKRVLKGMGIPKGASERYYSTSEVARILNVHPLTVTRWCREGKIKTITTLGGYYRIPASEVERLLTTRTKRKKRGQE